MPLTVNLRRLEVKPVTLQGQMPAADLQLEGVDELIHLPLPLKHDLEAQLMDDAVLVQGSFELTLRCECARCLQPFDLVLDFPDWAVHLPLTGDDAVEVRDDSVDLTPQMREDILLRFPQRPLCEAGCPGLKKPEGANKPSGASQSETSSAWAELNKLKLED